MKSETVALAGSPQEVGEMFAARMSAGDVDGASELYEETANFAPEPRTEVAGRTSIREALGGLAALKPQTSSTVEWVQVAGDTALVLNRWVLDGHQPDGEPVHISGHSADVMRRGADGGWRFVIDFPWLDALAAETSGGAK